MKLNMILVRHLDTATPTYYINVISYLFLSTVFQDRMQLLEFLCNREYTMKRKQQEEILNEYKVEYIVINK